MTRQISAAALLILTSFMFTSCSGVQQGVCTANCGGGGNATVSFVLTATPPALSSQLSIQAFTATMVGITLTPSTGAAVNVPLNSAAYIAEFTRVTSDSTLLAAQVSVPAATYTHMTITFSAPRVTFCTQPNPGVPGCATGTLTSVSGTAGSVVVTTNLSLAANQQTGIVLNANLGTALAVSGQTITTVNLSAANAFSASTLPPTSTQTDLASGQLSHVDDVMGLVTSASSSTLTVQTSSRGSITATANSSTQYGCSSQNFTCVQANTVAIIDTILNADGTLTLTFYQPVSASSLDVIEGVVTSVPNSVTNQFTIVATDSVFASSGSLLNGQLQLGDQILVTLNAPNPFQIISKGLLIPTGSAFENSNSVASILPGQTIAFPALSFAAQSGIIPGTATAKDIALRFTRVTTSLASASLPDFGGNATDFPPFFGITTNQQFRTTSGRLSLDGTSVLTNISAGTAISTTALYVGPPVAPQFAAQTVRAH
jgi:membrane-bound inhibitor of C-type lysozyme